MYRRNVVIFLFLKKKGIYDLEKKNPKLLLSKGQGVLKTKMSTHFFFRHLGEE